MLLLALIRRANLDSFWSTAPGTVYKHRLRLRAGLKFSASLNLMGPYLQYGSLPAYDHCGYEVAIHMLLNSLNPGRNDKNFTQWNSIRKMRTCYSNFVRASNQANQNTLAINDNKGRYTRIGKDPCGSFWFSRFLIGCRNRMGEIKKQNKAFGLKLMLKVIEEAERSLEAAEDFEEEHRWCVFICYITVAYVISLRGNEGFLVDLEGLNKHYSSKTQDYFIIALFGKLKGEANVGYHLIPCINVTGSGIPVRKIVYRLLKMKSKLGFYDGPAISDTKGKMLNSLDINNTLWDLLETIFEEDKSLFPSDIITKIEEADDIREGLSETYACFRTFRRTSDTRALNKKNELQNEDIDIVNRWRSVEAARGKGPNLPMKHHYADIQILLEPFLRYTKAM